MTTPSAADIREAESAAAQAFDAIRPLWPPPLTTGSTRARVAHALAHVAEVERKRTERAAERAARFGRR